MKKIKRVAIFSQATPEHVDWGIGLKQGMHANGVDVLTSWPFPNAEMVDSIIENFQPDVVFEINRHKDQIPKTSNPFFHVCLIHEHRSQDTIFTKTSGNSDFYYSIIRPSGFDFLPHLDDRARVFVPGFNTEVLNSITPQPKKYELGCEGFMGNPDFFEPSYMDHLIDTSRPELGTLNDLINYIGITKALLNQEDYVFQVRRRIEAYFLGHGFMAFKFMDYAYNLIFRLCEDEFVRTTNRKHLCDLMLNTSDNIAFWGTPLWKMWPKYAPFYKSELKSSQTVLEAYSSLDINIHSTGCNLHKRVIDTMAIGTPIALMRTQADDGPFGLDQFFEPDVHYISFTFDTFKDKIRYYLDNPEARNKIATAAKKRVEERFTWKERCRLILEDLEAVI